MLFLTPWVPAAFSTCFLMEFLWFATYIKEHSKPGQFYGKTYYYFFLDGYKYWSMDENPEDCDLINRDKVSDDER